MIVGTASEKVQKKSERLTITFCCFARKTQIETKLAGHSHPAGDDMASSLALADARAVVARARSRPFAPRRDVFRRGGSAVAVRPRAKNRHRRGDDSASSEISSSSSSSSQRGAFYTLVPIRPRRRGERRSLRTLPVVSLRPPLAFNPRPRRLSTPPDAFELHPDNRLYGTTLSGGGRRPPQRRRRPGRRRAQVPRGVVGDARTER